MRRIVNRHVCRPIAWSMSSPAGAPGTLLATGAAASVVTDGVALEAFAWTRSRRQTKCRNAMKVSLLRTPSTHTNSIDHSSLASRPGTGLGTLTGRTTPGRYATSTGPLVLSGPGRSGRVGVPLKTSVDSRTSLHGRYGVEQRLKDRANSCPPAV